MLQPQRNFGGEKDYWLLHSLLQKDKEKSQYANGHSCLLEIFWNEASVSREAAVCFQLSTNKLLED